jgi:hypothetical protein
VEWKSGGNDRTKSFLCMQQVGRDVRRDGKGERSEHVAGERKSSRCYS